MDASTTLANYQKKNQHLFLGQEMGLQFILHKFSEHNPDVHAISGDIANQSASKKERKRTSTAPPVYLLALLAFESSLGKQEQNSSWSQYYFQQN